MRLFIVVLDFFQRGEQVEIKQLVLVDQVEALDGVTLGVVFSLGSGSPCEEHRNE